MKYNSKSDRVSDVEKKERQLYRDRVSLGNAHKERKREAAEQASWKQFESFINGEEGQSPRPKGRSLNSKRGWLG